MKWSNLSWRTREALKVLFLTSIAMFVISLTGVYSVAESRFYDIRLKYWGQRTQIVDDKVFLVSITDKSVEEGFRDEELLRLLYALQEAGVEKSVILGTDVFETFDSFSGLLPENVVVFDPKSEESGARLLLQDRKDLLEQLDSDGVLRRLSVEHDIVKFWTSVRPEWEIPEDRTHVYLFPSRASTRDLSDAKIKHLVQDLAELKRTESTSASYKNSIVLIERATTIATEDAEIPTFSGDFPAGQVHLMLTESMFKEWNLYQVNWPTNLFLYFVLVSLYILCLTGRKPAFVGIASLLTLGAISAGSVLFLLPLGLDVRIVFLLLSLLTASILLVLFGLVRNRSLLEQFGGQEDAQFSGQESQATMVFTNLPRFLTEMERKHDENLLKYRREYNEILAIVARRYHGKVLDFQGDAQMLGFGLRYDDDTEHAAEATSAALEIVDEVAKLSVHWNAPLEQLSVSVGVCTGSIALGHLGALQKQDIAAIGDTTNTAARLMGAAMKQRVGVLISKQTYVQAEGLIKGTHLPPVELKGKSEPVEVLHATEVDRKWQQENRAKDKDVVPTGGTLDYSGRGQESLLITGVLAVLGFLLAYTLWHDGFMDAPEARIGDFLHQTLGMQPADPDIILVGIDSESANDPNLGGFPWSRGVYARAVENLKETGYAGIFLDVVFKKPRVTDPEGDAYLARMIEEEPRLVLAGTLLRNNRNRLEKPPFFPKADRDLMQQRCQIGLIHVQLDRDGKVRWGYLSAPETESHDQAEAHKRTIYPSAAAALLMSDEKDFHVARNEVRLGDRVIDAKVESSNISAIRIRYGPPATAEKTEPQPGSYRQVSFRRLLDPSDPIFNELEGKYLLVGQTRTDGKEDEVDRVDTIAGRLKGVEVHARILDSLLNGNYIRPSRQSDTEIYVLLVSALTFFILARYRKPGQYLYRLGLLYAAIGLAYVMCFLWFSVMIRLLVLWTTVTVVATSILVGRNIFTFRALTRVIPAEVAEELLFRQHARDRRQVATILLTDIRGYTTLSEGKSAVAMLDVLNEYHKRTVACYDRYGGQALTYQGDAQIVVFGVFGNRPNPAADAAAAALELQSICDVLREEWEIKNRDDFDVGAGLCTGEVEVGYMGGGDNLQYSVVGETVRKAHKVQSLSAELSAPVILDEETYQAAGGAVQVDDLGMVQPKGLPHEIRLYRAKSVEK